MIGRSILVLALLLAGCSSSHPPACEGSRVFACEVDDGAGMVEGHDREQVPTVSTCAVCRMVEEAFAERAADLGCCEAFPLDSCPLEAAGAFDGCFAWQADDHVEFVRSASSCRQLVERTATEANWTGFECGGRFCYVAPLEGRTIAEARSYCGGD